MTSTTNPSPDEWRELIRQHGSSGQSIKAFCERHGVAVSAFYYWRRRLNAEPTTPSTALAVSFVSVEASPEPVTPIELVLRGGRCLRVVAGFDGPTLLRLIDVVEGGA